ncbi:MAG: hypothetical protein DMENIID0002_01650 [Rickettsia endosymbiont of Sergentomyia squamirostris]|uniref:Uncharacterized protein n=1 Tax=Candidatus Tisiphia endosymbiont of Sergentomyia squamirostris TaxID=3113639 RepID=A0AAT9G6V2_9RICK
MSKFVRADGRVIHTQTSLTREQKEAIGLLIGTFLEYFDLMLYVHMSICCCINRQLLPLCSHTL